MADEDSDRYLEAFLDGYDFLLMALEGRMELMDEAAAEELAPFLKDYRRLGELLREKGISPRSRVPPKPRGRFIRAHDLGAALRN